jgi:hypothetical protein
MLYQVLHLAFFPVLLLALLDYALALLAPSWYFQTGVAVFRRSLGAKDLTAASVAQWIARKAPQRIFVRYSAVSRIGIREHFGFYLLYSALLHWQLCPPTGQTGWILIGRYKVYAIAYDLMIIAAVIMTVPVRWLVVPLAWGIIVTALIITIQLLHVRFLKELPALSETTFKTSGCS